MASTITHDNYIVKKIFKNKDQYNKEKDVYAKLTQLSGIHIIQIFFEDNILQQTSPYYPLGDLFEFLKRISDKGHMLRRNIAMNLYTQIVKTIKGMHSVNVHHGDIKAENIVIRRILYSTDVDQKEIKQMTVKIFRDTDELLQLIDCITQIEFKIIDFGNASCQQKRKAYEYLGTAGYMGPEVKKAIMNMAENEESSFIDGFKNDIYALGVLYPVIIFAQGFFSEEGGINKNYDYYLKNQENFFKFIQKRVPSFDYFDKHLIINCVDENPEKRWNIGQLYFYLISQSEENVKHHKGNK